VAVASPWDRSPGRTGSGPPRTLGQPCWSTNAISPKPTAVIDPSVAKVMLRTLSSNLSPNRDTGECIDRGSLTREGILEKTN
jgi:hypothetical protein